MGYRSILTLGTTPARMLPVLPVAARLALAQDAHLDVLAMGLDLTLPGYGAYGDSVAVLAMGLDEARSAATTAEVALRAALDTEDTTLRWSVEAEVVAAAGMAALCANAAAYSDLVVLPRPYGPGAGSEDVAMVEAAMIDGRAPVLVLPAGFGRDRSLGRRVVIAWNGTAPAMAAVRRALPFLMAAEAVNVAIIDPPPQGPERSDPGGLLCRLLARHGIAAEVAVLARSAPRVADVLHRHLRDRDADLLVMGAYGHSRLREALLGGTTRAMLEEAEVPLFLAH